MEVPGFNLVTGQYYRYGNENMVEIKDFIYPALIPLVEYYGGYGDVMMKRTGNRSGMPENVLMMDAVAAPAHAPEAKMQAGQDGELYEEVMPSVNPEIKKVTPEKSNT
jgi:hypothetical protein